MPVALVSGHVWDYVVLNACAVKSVFTCFSIIFSQLVRRASCCSAIACDLSDLFTSACIQSKAFRKFVCFLFWRNKLNVVYVSNPWSWTGNMYFSIPLASVFNSIQPWRHKFQSAGCWKISALLENQRLADFPAPHWFSSTFPTLFQQLAGRLDAGVYKLAVCKHTGLQLWTLLMQGRVLLAEGSSCGCAISYLKVRDRSEV